MFDLLSTIKQIAYSTKAKLLQIRAVAWGAEDEDGAVLDEEDTHFLQPFGFAVLPVVTSTLRAWGWQDGHEHWVPWVFDPAKAIADLIIGETRIYSVGKVTVAISLRQDGSLRVNSDGGDVVLNGGTLKVARNTDPVVVGAAMTTWMAAVTAATGVPALVGTTIGTVSGGASNVKA